MVKRIEINVYDVELKQISVNVSYSYNINRVLCKNTKPTGATAKCLIASSLNNLREIKDIIFPYSQFDFQNYSTKINFKLDNDYTFSTLDISPKDVVGIDKTINLKTSATWSLEDNTINEFNLFSARLQNNNNMEALIPLGCFNLTMREKIFTIPISYTSVAKFKMYDENDQMITESSLYSLAHSIIKNTTNYTNSSSFITMRINGEIKVNMIETDYSEVAPCFINDV